MDRDERGDGRPLQGVHAEFDELTSKDRYAHSSWGLMVFDPQSKSTLIDIRSDEMFIPGSTTKLFTTAAILMEMGPDHRFITPAYVGSIDEGGVVNGPVFLKASGDPKMGGRDMGDDRINYTDEDHSYAFVQGGCILVSEDPLAGIDSLVQQMYEEGVRSVEDVVIDDTLFETVDLEAFVVSPIVINDNLLDIMITPGAAGELGTIEIRPYTEFYTIKNEVVTNDDPTDISITASGREVTVSGNIKLGSGKMNLTHTVMEPADFARALMIESMERHGIEVLSTLESNPRELIPSDYDGMIEVASITSAPLSEEVKLTNKVSHNLHAETYLSLMAASRGERTPYDGLMVEREMLEQLGIDLDALCLIDGMGGPLENLFTPRAAVQLLMAMMDREEFQVFFDSLPVLGVDGSLAHAIGEGPAIGNVYAKTGSKVGYDILGDTGMAQTKALARYIDPASGKRLIFALFVNNVPVDDYDDIMALGTDLARVSDMIYRHF